MGKKTTKKTVSLVGNGIGRRCVCFATPARRRRRRRRDFADSTEHSSSAQNKYADLSAPCSFFSLSHSHSFARSLRLVIIILYPPPADVYCALRGALRCDADQWTPPERGDGNRTRANAVHQLVRDDDGKTRIFFFSEKVLVERYTYLRGTTVAAV